jgi:hypothetical protein
MLARGADLLRVAQLFTSLNLTKGPRGCRIPATLREIIFQNVMVHQSTGFDKEQDVIIFGWPDWPYGFNGWVSPIGLCRPCP